MDGMLGMAANATELGVPSNCHVQQVRIMVLPGNRVDRKNAARALNRSPKTLAEWKRLGIGPKAFNIGGRIFYDWGDVQTFLQQAAA